MPTKALSKEGQRVLSDVTQKVKEYKAKQQTFLKSEMKKAETTDGKAQIKAWVDGIRNKDLTRLKNVSDEVEQTYKSQNITTNGDGGFLVPTVVEAAIVERLVTVAPLRSQANVISNAPAKFQINSQVARPDVDWTAEEAAYNATKMTVDDTVITAFKTTGIIPLTEEFEQDALGIDGVREMLQRQLGEAIGIKENTAFITGDGTTRPYGFRNLSFAGGAASRALASDFGVLDFDDVKDLKRALTQANRRGSFFLGNDEIEGALDKIKDNDGRYIYKDSVDESEFGRLLSRPFINADEHTNNELWHINGRGYVITDVAGIRIDFGLATGDFEEGRRSLRVMKRTGGNVVLSELFAKLTIADASS
jgi:HK97 family phage major capsid protein